MTVWLPTLRLERGKVALPPLKVIGLWATPSMLKTTEPSGVPPGEVNWAVKLTCWPKVVVLGVRVKVPLVVARATVTPPVSVPLLAL